MSIDYISGFFDADGSVTLVREHKYSKTKSPKVDFTNIKITILEEIRDYLLEEHGIKGYISKKPARKEKHSDSYVLSYSWGNAVKICQIIKSKHPVKKHRLSVVNKWYQVLIVRNGKYTEKQLQRKLASERLFFWSSVS